VVIGVLLISVLPEAAFVLPVLDVVGLDVVTIFAALELRHYLASVARLVGIPTSVAVYLRVPAQVVSRCGDVLRTNPVLWLYACMWPVIWLRTWDDESVAACRQFQWLRHASIATQKRRAGCRSDRQSFVVSGQDRHRCPRGFRRAGATTETEHAISHHSCL